MCGIVYKKSFNGKPVNREVRRQYFKQRDRGMDGYGFVSVGRDGTAKLSKELYEHQIMHDLKPKSTEIIFHHRWPTSTKNSQQTNHPILTKHKKYRHNYYLVHNGMILNDDELLKEHKRLGISYKTMLGNSQFNDSECLLHELALTIEGIKPYNKFNARGSVAFVLLQTDKHDKSERLFFGRNYGSPLRIQNNPTNGLSISSEGYGEDVPTNKLFAYNYKDKQIYAMAMEMPYGSVDRWDDTLNRQYDYDTYHNRLPSRLDLDDDDFEDEDLILMTEAELQDYYYDLVVQEDGLKTEINRATRDKNYELETDLLEELDDVEMLLDKADHEIQRRKLKSRINTC